MIRTNYHQSNGRIERFNRTLREYIRKMDKNKKLEEHIERAIDIYNRTLHSGIRVTPVEELASKLMDKYKETNEKIRSQHKRTRPYAKGFNKLHRNRYIKR
ncbi:hypothetical protein PAEPH01_2882 [Pancytospora epiphaga]|nr:hypothetical protein PAEPH01_2882 [Pancytospora epiphaga]